MYDPTEWVCGGRFGYIMRHCRADYMRGSPLVEKLNPLRYQIGFGSSRPAKLIWNEGAWMNTRWSNFNWWLWKRHWWEWRERRHKARREELLRQMVAADEAMGLYDDEPIASGIAVRMDGDPSGAPREAQEPGGEAETPESTPL